MSHWWTANGKRALRAPLHLEPLEQRNLLSGLVFVPSPPVSGGSLVGAACDRGPHQDDGGPAGHCGGGPGLRCGRQGIPAVAVCRPQIGGARCDGERRSGRFTGGPVVVGSGLIPHSGP
jgi:hypothetical protein